MKNAPRIIFGLVTVLALSSLPACSGAPKSDLHMMPLSQFPAEVQSAPVDVREAYQFAAANPDVMRAIPCYCGCVNIGHKSNYDCYVLSAYPTGGVVIDPHALNCQVCIDITQDATRLLREGRTAPEIKAYVDSVYSKLGNSTMP